MHPPDWVVEVREELLDNDRQSYQEWDKSNEPKIHAPNNGPVCRGAMVFSGDLRECR